MKIQVNTDSLDPHTEDHDLAWALVKVIDENVSVPFNPMEFQAWNIKNPDVVDMPDYGQPNT